MEQKLLIVNTGSTSRKYAYFVGDKPLVTATFESNDQGVNGTLVYQNQKETCNVSSLSLAKTYLLEWLAQKQLLDDVHSLSAVVIRVVAPGLYFQHHRQIDDEYIINLRQARDQAPLHTNSTLEEVESFRQYFPKLRLLGISDSAFHAQLPPKAHLYAINYQDSQNYGIRRFGYHGISLESILSQILAKWFSIPEKLIVCHLGGGASVTAIHKGISVDTSMGLTPLEGLIMASRSGDVGPGVMIELMKRRNSDAQGIEQYLHYDCGLKGISGQTGDMKQLLDMASMGNQQAQLAIDMYIYRLQKYIGGLAATLGGLDMLVFSATIGERSAKIRHLVCENLRFLGINLDMEKNEQTNASLELIHSCTSQVKVAVVPTDEATQMVKISQTIH